MNLRSIFANFQEIVANRMDSDIYYVTDKANWSFYWDAYYITTALRKNLGLRAQITRDPWKLKNKIIHFGDRYAYLSGPFRTIDPSNRVFLTWFHGAPNDPDTNIQRLLSIMPDAVQYIQKIVVTCNISRNALVGVGIPEAKLITIPLGVELKLFSAPTAQYRLRLRQKLGIPENVFCIGSFQKDGSGWGEGAEPKLIKGPDVFLEVIAKLHTHHKNLLILLTGPARGYVKKGLEKLGVPYIHQFLSRYQDIVPYYQAVDLYIITSRSEGGPKALLESWATGVPVVSTRVGMPADLIRHGVNGMITDIGDVDGLASYAMALMEDDALRNKCRIRALEEIMQFDWSLIAQRYYQNLYQRILG